MHTPGPWFFNVGKDKKYSQVYIYGPTTNVIAKLVYRRNPRPKIEDARLIAAAPELLAAAKLILNNNNDALAIAKLKIVVDKAEGTE